MLYDSCRNKRSKSKSRGVDEATELRSSRKRAKVGFVNRKLCGSGTACQPPDRWSLGLHLLKRHRRGTIEGNSLKRFRASPPPNINLNSTSFQSHHNFTVTLG